MIFKLVEIKNKTKLNILAGSYKLKIESNTIFNDISKKFLNDLSKLLFKDKEIRKFADVTSFAFWTRKSNLDLIEKKIVDDKLRVGIGLVFHITPTNVPINFCYSFAFGLLSYKLYFERNMAKPINAPAKLKKSLSERRISGLR